MLRYLNYKFPYLDNFRQRLIHVAIILIFSIFFLVTFEPFNITSWINYPDWLKYYGLVGIAVFTSTIIAFSQLLIRSYLPLKQFQVKHLIVWFVFEILLISITLTFLFKDPELNFFGELLITLKFNSVALLLPYTFSILILILFYQKERLEHIEIPKNIEKEVGETDELIKFKDERDLVKFTLKKSYILFFESADNYISIVYLI